MISALKILAVASSSNLSLYKKYVSFIDRDSSPPRPSHYTQYYTIRQGGFIG